MATQFGNTWWGEQWLNALSDIDFSNRLPRGKTYARKGAVKNIRFKKNIIEAKVKGSRPSTYKVKISVPLFSDSDNQKIISTITQNPLILSKLLNRQLPMELHGMARKKKIRIFPSAWSDFQMHCTCPDWAVPCKHLASVIYVIANEIDRNPFIIFQLHGLDVLKELEKNGYENEETTSKIPSPKDRMIEQAEDTGDHLRDVNIDRFDFSAIPELNEPILSLLEDKPLFYKSDFKIQLNKAYKRISRNTTKYLNQSTKHASEENYEKYDRLEVVMNNEVFWFDAILYSNGEEKHFGKKGGIGTFIDYLDAIPAKMISRLSRPLLAMVMMYKFSLKLLEKSAFIPEMLELAENKYMIRWIPASMNEEVEKLYKALVKLTPGDMVQIMDASFDVRYFEPKEQVKVLCSLFLDYFVNEYASQYIKDEDPIDNFFFRYSTHRFSDLGEQEIPQTIHQWISKFYIHHKNFVPVIKVEDEEDVFSVSVMIEDREHALLEPVSLKSFMTDNKYRHARMSVLRDLTLLSSSFSELESVINSQGEETPEFDSEKFAEVLLRILPVIRMHGIRILLPNALKKLVRPQSSLALSKKQEGSKEMSFMSLHDMLEFDWQIALGDQTLSPEEFFKLVENMSGIVRIKNQYVLIDQSELERLRKNLSETPMLKPNEALQAAMSEEYKRAKIKVFPEVKALIHSFLRTEKVDLPGGLEATLRPYQVRGYEWMFKNLNVGIGSIIADDMGLGKTLQVITLLLKMKEQGHLKKHKALVIVPTTLLTNWEKEIKKFAPTLTSFIYHGTNRSLDNTHADVIITTYGVARSDIAMLQKLRWACVIIDEAQNIKNPSAEQTKAVKKIKSKVRIAMSGTPVENRLSEYWSVFDFTNKGYLGSLNNFRNEFAKPIETERNHEVLESFRNITAPFIMRRLKTDKTIISDLPDKVENNKFAALTKEQAAIYTNVVKEMMPSIEETGDDQDSRIKRQGMVFKLMIALKQICNHPNQYLKKEDYHPELSGKTLLLMQLLENIYETGEKTLIFTQFKEMGMMLEKIINERFDTPVMFLHGGTSRKKRDEMVQNFQQKNHLKTFILSIKAAGTGLNLTSASNVIHYDLWWNPAVENQATDRAYRIGQEKNVMVYRLITRDTFEEKINDMIQTKKELADLTVNAGEKWIGELSNRELKELVEI